MNDAADAGRETGRDADDHKGHVNSAAARRPGRGWLAVALLVPALGVLETAADGYFAGRPPAFDDYFELRGPVAAQKAPGDKVIVAPRWAEPLVRRALGDELMPLRDVAEQDLRFYEGVIEISILGQRSPDVLGFREVDRRQVGRFELRRLVNPSPLRKRFDFVSELSPTRVDVRGTNPPVSCPWNERATPMSGGLGGNPTFPAKRFECPGSPFLNVSVTVIADEEFRARRCIWAHPLRDGELSIRYERVPLGSVIAGRSGMYWMIERARAGAPVTMRIRVDGHEVGTVVHTDGQGFAPFEVPLGIHAGAASAEVEFAVSSENYAHRHYCFEAHSR